jgi:hypothetical protein
LIGWNLELSGDYVHFNKSNAINYIFILQLCHNVDVITSMNSWFVPMGSSIGCEPRIMKQMPLVRISHSLCMDMSIILLFYLLKE